MTWGVLLAGGGVVQLSLWAWQRRTRNAATIDVGWVVLVAAGVVAAGVAQVASGAGSWVAPATVMAMHLLWAVRLGGHLLRDRVLAGDEEDGRYRALREAWREQANRNLLLLYLVQVPFAALFVLPVAAAMRVVALDGWLVAGVTMSVLALAGEWLADAQLARFRADPASRGGVCRRGLWRFSRHPNYFFEWVHWWGYVLCGRGTPVTWIGPAAMLLFLFRVTGIPHTERQALRSRGEGYRAYQRTTSVFIPWWPRSA